MFSIPLEYQPFIPGLGFFILIGFGILTLILAVITIMDILFAKFRSNGDLLLWGLLLLVSAGLACYIYIFKRKDLLLSKGKVVK